MKEHARIIPGDRISALGYTFTVWIILYQDCYDGIYDVEFLDDRNCYHHWKQQYDGGTVDLSGTPGQYYHNPNDRSRIACIRESRKPGTYTARIIDLRGNETYLGRYSSIPSALKRLDNTGAEWRQM